VKIKSLFKVKKNHSTLIIIEMELVKSIDVMVGYCLSVSADGSCAKSLAPRLVVLRDRGTFKKWGLVEVN
jgi:hypothetical protein